MTDQRATIMTEPPQRRAGRPSREEAQAIEVMILDRTIDALRDARYATLSIDALAQDIGVTKQTIYRRFPSKDALIDAAIQHKMAQLHAFASDTAGTAPEPVEGLRAFARHLFAMLLKPENMGLAIFINHASLTDAEFARRQRHWHAMLMAPMTCAIVRAQQRELLRSGDAEQMAHMLFDLLSGPVNRLRASLDPHLALDGLCEDRAFAARFDAFLTLYGMK
ncbi:TetR/AcrR family transcriptional regulator [Sphingomonadaceae bacterium OTU29MARTA1]|nr:TetR/AcrR family transcriptional regulator [Sphingomonadaceae bacterium OTU29LAMAA1]USU09493.1 TetR/AcrR family transcriptional regulator [Sphingomonadaceae bacterium OTU29MARTA1]USU12928.1 TetR/AcrR family transcriptional regulator [Sphingomonadaceae bacterium OTU29THOMA1]